MNAVITCRTTKGIVVGLSSGAVYLWDSPVLADGTIVPGASAGGGCSVTMSAVAGKSSAGRATLV